MGITIRKAKFTIGDRVVVLFDGQRFTTTITGIYTGVDGKMWYNIVDGCEGVGYPEERLTLVQGEKKVTMDQFVISVKEMRRLQRDYYRTRSQTVLTNSKRAEAEVDRLLNLIEESKTPQTRIF